MNIKSDKPLKRDEIAQLVAWLARYGRIADPGEMAHAFLVAAAKVASVA